jgi:hypothetical protein
MPTSKKRLRDAVYVRISEDELGEGKGVERQFEDGRTLARRDGSVIAGEFNDNEISALKGAHRPGYERLLTAVRAGQVDRVAARHDETEPTPAQERQHRQPRLGRVSPQMTCGSCHMIDYSVTLRRSRRTGPLAARHARVLGGGRSQRSIWAAGRHQHSEPPRVRRHDGDT